MSPSGVTRSLPVRQSATTRQAITGTGGGLKLCKACRQEKPLDDFSPHPSTADRLQPKCKPCRASHSREARRRDRRHYRRKGREHQRTSYERHAEEKRQARRDRYNTASETARRQAERAAHPEKFRAREALRYAIRRGRIVRPDRCDSCGTACKPEAHHPDYSRPLEVEWLCSTCHGLTTRIAA
jgi:hypothetical protein